MVVLTPKFTLLASLSAIAAFALLPPAEGLSIQSRQVPGLPLPQLDTPSDLPGTLLGGLGSAIPQQGGVNVPTKRTPELLTPLGGLAKLPPGPPSLRRNAGQEVVEKRGKHLRLSHEYEKFDHHHLAPANVKATANGYGNRIRNRKRQNPNIKLGGHVFREYPKQKRDEEQQKVPGRIAIMSPSADSRDGKSIATLSLSSGTNKPTNGSAFVLNASGTNATQVYLVPASSHQNQTQPGESTPEYQAVEVHLHIEAAGNDFCATFDPNPPKPAPLTAEQCTNGARSAHKSQTFAYYPESGAIRPMWYEGEETDGGDDEDPTPDDDDSGYDGVNNSTNSDQDPGTPTSSKVVGITSLAANTRPPALLKSFIAESNPQNVTLVFQPILGGNSTSPSSNSTAPATNSTSSSTTLTPTPSPSTFAAAQIASVSVVIPVSPTTSASSSTSSSLSSTSSGSSTPTPAPTPGVVDIEVFNPYVLESSSTTNSTSSIVTVTPASSSTSASVSGSASANVNAIGSSSSIATIGSSTSSTISTSATASSTESAGATASASPSMTAVSTAPYDWMFKEGTVRDQ